MYTYRLLRHERELAIHCPGLRHHDAYDECSCVSRNAQTPNQCRRRNCSCRMRAVEKAHTMSTKTGNILDGGSSSTSCQRISSTPITAERICVSGRRSYAPIARATRRRLPWVDYLIPCPSWQWRERGKVSFLRNKLHIIFYLFLGSVLQIGRPLVRFQMVSLAFFIDIILPIALWPWGRLSL
jgi:hypothetical protein